jgi:hypothetical protein
MNRRGAQSTRARAGSTEWLFVFEAQTRFSGKTKRVELIVRPDIERFFARVEKAPGTRG